MKTTSLLSFILLTSISISAMEEPDRNHNSTLELFKRTFAQYHANQANNYIRGKTLFYKAKSFKDYTTAAQLLQIVATSDYVFPFTADAQIVLGQLYYYGYGAVHQNLSHAQTLFNAAAQNSTNLCDNFKANLYLGRLAAEIYPPNFGVANMHIGPVQAGLPLLDEKTQLMLQAHIDYVKGLEQLQVHNNYVAAITHFQSIPKNPLAGGRTKLQAHSMLSALAAQKQ